MKTWQQFNEDAQSYARDKEAYEKQTAAHQKLEARRSAAKEKSKSSKNFTKIQQQKAAEIKRRGMKQRSEYDSDVEYSDKVKELKKQQSKRSVQRGAAAFDATVGAIKGTAKFVKNRLRKTN